MSEAFELFLVIAAVSSPAFIIIFIKYYFRYKSELSARMTGLKHQMDSHATEKLTEEVRQLKERLEVLETIVTDNRFELYQDFKTLQK